MAIDWITPTLIAIAVPTAFAILRSRAVSARAIKSSDATIFPPIAGVKWVLSVGVVLGLAGVVGTLLLKMQWWVSCFFGGFLLLMALGWPPTITVSDRGLLRESWWRRPLEIPWTGIYEIRPSKSGPGTAYVVADRQGNKIEVSIFHAAFHEIGSEITKRTGRECPRLASPFG